VEAAVRAMNEWFEQISFILTMLGARTIDEIRKSPPVITKDVREWAELRRIDVLAFARR